MSTVVCNPTLRYEALTSYPWNTELQAGPGVKVTYLLY